MRKMRLIVLILLLALALSLAACGAEPAEAPADMQSTLPGTTGTEAAPPTEEPGEETVDPLAETKAAILALKDHPVDELYALIGEPNSSDYAPSCLGPGEDGCLYYDDFTVYTYRENDRETVYDVE